MATTFKEVKFGQVGGASVAGAVGAAARPARGGEEDQHCGTHEYSEDRSAKQKQMR